MDFDWGNYLLLARKLAQENDEASLRSAISRAYYAAFHKARQHQQAHLGNYVPDPNVGSHEEVWLFYRDHADRDYNTIAIWGFRLKGDRVRADYRENVVINPQKVNDTCVTALRLINTLANL